jgi:hypothetical protein
MDQLSRNRREEDE